jgi:hypothetical protein
MQSRLLAGLVLVSLLTAETAAAEDVPTVAVMKLTPKGGITIKHLDSLSDLLATEIRKTGRYRVISSNDIVSLLKMEEHKSLLGCADDSCLAEIGGALGAGQMVVGNIGKFGDAYLLNLKLLDVVNVKAVARISKKVKGGEEDLIDALSVSARELFGLSGDSQVDVYENARSSAYTKWGHGTFWSGLALTAFGGLAIWQAQVAADDYGQTGSSSAADHNELWNGLASTGFVLGGALLATGVVLWILAPDDANPGQTAGLALSPDGSGVVLTVVGRW